jgi:putative oxidoreductase
MVNAEATWTDRAKKAVLLIRILVGRVFLSQGKQKFLFADSLGVGRFVKIGIPWPQVMAPFVGVVEIVCGSLLLSGLLARLATVPFLIDRRRSVFDQNRHVRKERVLEHLARSPHRRSMLLGLIFLLVVGSGAWSPDAPLARRKDQSHG